MDTGFDSLRFQQTGYFKDFDEKPQEEKDALIKSVYDKLAIEREDEANFRSYWKMRN